MLESMGNVGDNYRVFENIEKYGIMWKDVRGYWIIVRRWKDVG